MVKRLGLWKRSLPTAAGLGNQRTSIVSILCSNGGTIMAHTRFWKPTAVLCMLPVLLVLGMAAASAQAPATGKAKVDRLVMGLIEKYRDYIRPWIPPGSADHMIQHDPAFEWLFEVDPESGKYNPWLAESSE